jgi:cold shock CspA family protein/ribosome-associated translation inhibitor RaiA
MDAPLNITFHDLEKSEFVEARIRERADRLERRFGRIVSCSVTVAAPHASQRKGKLYSCSVDVSIPGAEIVANRNPGNDRNHEDIRAAVRDAFDAAERQLEDIARVKRGEIKQREAPPEGRVRSLFPDYGFIATGDGQEIYFHKNAVAGDFDKLQVGDIVRFVAQEGESPIGAQASTVTPLAREHPQPDRRG